MDKDERNMDHKDNISNGDLIEETPQERLIRQLEEFSVTKYFLKRIPVLIIILIFFELLSKLTS